MIPRAAITAWARMACFAPYRPDGYTAERARAGLEEHLADPAFRGDVLPLLRELPERYDVDAAGALVRDSLLVLV